MDEDDEIVGLIEQLANERPPVRRWFVNTIAVPALRALNELWPAWRHGGQKPPPGEWTSWLLMAGRGFGKTRAGSEWVSMIARSNGGARIALIGATADDVRKVMIEGESGLAAVAQTGEHVEWMPTSGVFRFASGAEAFVYSGENPEKLRGPEHHYAWCDELAKWRHPERTWNNLQLGLRLGDRPRSLVTTTPRPLRLLTALLKDAEVTRGATTDNLNLPEKFVQHVQGMYEGTRFARQELNGELIDDVEGALWSRDLIEKSRVEAAPACKRVVIGVDPPAGSDASSDACGIVVVGLGADGVGYVLADATVQGMSPEGWAAAVAAAAELHGADRVVAEGNNGGKMVESVLRAADAGLPVKMVHASRGKVARAEPVMTLYANKKAKHVGAFPDLEDQLAGFTTGGGYEGPGRSPDRADALVWAMTELLLGKQGADPRVRVV